MWGGGGWPPGPRADAGQGRGASDHWVYGGRCVEGGAVVVGGGRVHVVAGRRLIQHVHKPPMP